MTDERRVVVGVDGSPAARAALDFALTEARLRGAGLTAVLAVEVPEYGWINPYVFGGHDPRDELLPHAQKALADILASADTDGVDVRPLVVAAPVARALVDQSDGHLLLVVGATGRGGVRGIVGSVSLQCTLHARCPVTVVRDST